MGDPVKEGFQSLERLLQEEEEAVRQERWKELSPILTRFQNLWGEISSQLAPEQTQALIEKSERIRLLREEKRDTLSRKISENQNLSHSLGSLGHEEKSSSFYFDSQE